MRVDHYQELMDRGWRRSGHLYYKPDLTRSCCPQYTIRLDATQFESKRAQRKAVHQWNRHVLGPEYIRKLKIYCPVSKEEKRRKRDKFHVVEASHAAELSQLKRPLDRTTKQPLDPEHKFEVNIEADSFTKEKYRVFLKYQVQIHKDRKSRWGHDDFTRFLCSGLGQRALKIDGVTKRFGSYHQCYRLDGRLVAVGVLDLLPHAVSSVYLFYDPEFEAFQFGKISALREITLAIECQYRYYYMGFYIHSCVKMRYKGEYGPAHLLDPKSLQWNLFDDMYRKRLDTTKYLSLAEEREKEIGYQDRQGPMEIEAKDGYHKTTCEENKRSSPLQARGENNTDDLQVDPESSDDEDTEISEGSLFDYNMPGILSKEDVQKLDLDHWKLLVRDSLVDLEDLRGWEQWKIDDPYSIKGIAAELAATIGPLVLENSAISLL